MLVKGVIGNSDIHNEQEGKYISGYLILQKELLYNKILTILGHFKCIFNSSNMSNSFFPVSASLHCKQSGTKTKFGSQNFGYQIWFCTRLVNWLIQLPHMSHWDPQWTHVQPMSQGRPVSVKFTRFVLWNVSQPVWCWIKYRKQLNILLSMISKLKWHR